MFDKPKKETVIVRYRKPIWFAIGLVASLFVFMQVFQVQSHAKKEEKKEMRYNTLTPEEERVILHKGTERPFTGAYYDHKTKGYYICKRCDAPLYKSEDKFDSGCGWPSFDDEIFNSVKRAPDADGIRVEILCNNCGAHLGHVFKGEKFTAKNIRHCVNSISLNFIPVEKTERAIFASGCFWGTEYHMQKQRGVLETTVGFTGGHTKNPSYKDVCAGTTGHAEAVEVVFVPEIVSYEALTKLFFETHDPSQINRQGPDIGDQYRTEIFYLNDRQKKTAIKLIDVLKSKGYDVVTGVTRASVFWKAEGYHQDYYTKKNGTPYCHIYSKKF
jgi:peptide methionine sulfoxide reductase msrA/msrB